MSLLGAAEFFIEGDYALRLAVLGLLGSMVTLGGATEASATILTYTFTGTVSAEEDDLGLIGSSLVGQAYTDVETFDFSQMPHMTSAGVYEGGSFLGTPVFGTSKITVGTYSETSIGTFDAELAINSNFSITTQIRPYSYYNDGNFASETDEQVFSSSVGNGLTPGTIIPTAASGNYGVETGGTIGTFTNLTLTPTQLVISVSSGVGVSTVPLPASAPLFGAALGVLGFLGYGLKRKKEAAVV